MKIYNLFIIIMVKVPKKKIKSIVIYGETWCPYCKNSKTIARKISNSVKFVSGLSSTEIKKKLKLKSTPSTIPQIQVDGKYIGGFSNLSKLL